VCVFVCVCVDSDTSFFVPMCVCVCVCVDSDVYLSWMCPIHPFLYNPFKDTSTYTILSRIVLYRCVLKTDNPFKDCIV